MSLHAIAADTDLPALRARLRAALREPSGLVYGNGLEQPPTALEFTPDLSAGEQTALAAILGEQPEKAAATADLAQQYQAAITRLDQIAAGGFANNTARDAAIVDLARILKRALRFVKAQVG